MLLIGVHLAMVIYLIVTVLFVFNWIQSVAGDDVLVAEGTTWTAEVEFRAPCGDGTFLEGELPEGRLAVPCPSGVDEAAWQPQAVSVVAHVPIPNTKAHLYLGGFTALQMAALWGILSAVRHFTRATADRRVFIADNARYLARIGMLVLALPLLATVGEVVYASALPDTVTGISMFSVQFALQDSWPLLVLCGLIILAVSSSFRYGVELQEFEESVV